MDYEHTVVFNGIVSVDNFVGLVAQGTGGGIVKPRNRYGCLPLYKRLN